MQSSYSNQYQRKERSNNIIIWIAIYFLEEKFMEDFREIYSMIYDNEERGNNGFGTLLGKYRCIKQM